MPARGSTKARFLLAMTTIAIGCGGGQNKDGGNSPEPPDFSAGVIDKDMAIAVDLARENDLAQDDGGVTPFSGHKVDVLFMVDNSPSMDSMQALLKAHFADFITPLENVAAPGSPIDLHVGVVTSDYGAGAVPDLAGGCDASPGGQHGYLQTTAAKGTPQAGCSGPQGAPYLTYRNDGNGTITTNVAAGSTVIDTFGCMASVGSGGCGFEHQLESVYAALHNTTQNAGFLRPDALLAVVFLTNEDDSSAPPTTDIFNPDPAKVAMYGLLDTYRQTRFGVACTVGGKLALTPYGDSGGALAGCEAAENDNSVMLGAEFDVSRYIDFFTKPTSAGGVKADPTAVLLAAIDAPETPVTIIQVSFGTGSGVGAYPNPAAYQPCPAPNVVDGKSCIVRLQHSCQNVVQPAVFGDPAVRLNTVVRAASASTIASICGATPATAAPDYTAAMTSMANLIKSRLH